MPAASDELGARQLRRLERLMDVVFGLAIWRVFTTLPRPDADNLQWESVLQMLAEEWPQFLTALIGVLILVVFWVQNNALFSLLRKTDSVHSGLAVFQLFFVLLLLYAIKLSIVGGSAPDTRVFESVAATLVGLFAYLAWRYAARRRRLIESELSDDAIRETSRRNLAEPLTALMTIPFAFVGPLVWELSWFLYPIIQRLVRRRMPD
jgi:uncharacterized membrane protein